MIQLDYYQIDTTTVCPYCMSEVSSDQGGCCGESSCHFEKAYIDSNNEIHLESECIIVKPWLSAIRHNLNRHILKHKIMRFYRTKVRRGLRF